MPRLNLRQSKRYLLLSLLIPFLASACPALAETYVQFAGRMMSAGQFQADIEKALFFKVNAYRSAQGRQQLAPDATLQFAARAHAKDMAMHGFMGHVASTGQDFESRMRAFKGGGMIVLPSMGENAADVNPSVADAAEGLFQAWLHSEEHRRNMVSRDYIRSGIGVTVAANGKTYADQIFSGGLVKSNIFSSGQ